MHGDYFRAVENHFLTVRSVECELADDLEISISALDKLTTISESSDTIVTYVYLK